jgi:acetyl esterase
VRVGILIPTRGVVMESARRPPVLGCWAMARHADRAGYDAVWVGDSIVAKPRLEALTTLAYLAGIVSLDFRQAPDHRFPLASHDVAAGVRYVRAHAGRLGVDPARVAIVGSSSGGHLALLHAVRPAAHSGTPIVRPDGSLDAGATDASVAFAVALYPVADPLARYRYALAREDEPPPPSGFDAKRLIASHRAFFADETAMSAASVTRVVASGEAAALPPVWVAQPELDDNVPAEITEAFVRAYQAAGGPIDRAHFPGARHGFIQQASPDTDKAIALIRDFIGRQLSGA